MGAQFYQHVSVSVCYLFVESLHDSGYGGIPDSRIEISHNEYGVSTTDVVYYSLKIVKELFSFFYCLAYVRCVDADKVNFSLGEIYCNFNYILVYVFDPFNIAFKFFMN